jgi:rhamnulokinase
MATKNYLAIDIGAESGRAVLGKFDGKRFELEEIHRFANGPIRILDTLQWDAPGLYRETLNGIAQTVRKSGPPVSIGVDAWGVDFGFIGPGGNLVGLPVCYRDPRTEGILEHAYGIVPKDEIYRRTGLQFMRINSLFQLLAVSRETRFDPFAGAARLLFVPDLLNYFLTGVQAAEYTIASTSQMLDARGKDWDRELLERFRLPVGLLAEVRPTGSVLGNLLPAVAADTGATGTVCVATASHDTAAAVAAVPAIGDDWCFISSGTWSLMGAELAEPMITPAALAGNFTNEGGVAGTIRFLKNIMGLWLVQQCRKSFDRRGFKEDYGTLTELAAAAPAFGPIINPDHESLLNPSDMPDAIAAYCTRTGQKPPQQPGHFIRCCLESLALRYRYTLELMEQVLGRKFATIHVVGGGSRNVLLCQMTADCCQRRVVAGPVEGTALGNCLVQAYGRGELGSLAQMREVVRTSSHTVEYLPTSRDGWDDHYAAFEKLANA